MNKNIYKFTPTQKKKQNKTKQKTKTKIFASYLWSEVFSSDMFAKFKSNDKTLDAALGKQYRDTVLAPGYERDSIDSLVRVFVSVCVSVCLYACLCSCVSTL